MINKHLIKFCREKHIYTSLNIDIGLIIRRIFQKDID